MDGGVRVSTSEIPVPEPHQGEPRSIVLIGPMGSGKSTVGAALARRLARPHVDSDHFFVARHGPIADFFRGHGEQAFRAEEERLVAELLDAPRPSVISLGGGSVLSAATRERLRPHLVVMLDLTVEQALPRLGDGSSRPMLGGDPATRWAETYAVREPLYRQSADVVLDPADGTIEQRVDTIVAQLDRGRRARSDD